MKYAILVARILLGLMFLVFGANKLLHFLPMQMPPGDAGLYMSLLATHKILTVVALLEIIGGVLLLVGRYVPLGLTLLGPVVVNILLFHLFFAPSGLPLALVTVALEAFLILVYRVAFYGIFAAEPIVLRPKL